MAQECILICTVGGSHQPIVASIRRHGPGVVHFLCSDDVGNVKGSYTQVVGEGKVLKSRREIDKPDLPNLATLAGMSDDQVYVHKIKGFDDLNACYLETVRVIAEARRRAPEARIVIDYTGGTKSMTAGLAAAALDDGRCEISLVAGQRKDLSVVQDQTEFVRPLHVWDAQALRRIQASREVLRRYDYSAAEEILADAAARFAGEHTLKQLQRGIALCRAFDAWDKFRHADAKRLLEPYQSAFIPWWRMVRCLAGESRGHGFEWVEDLILNAQRRALQERFDDAIGRVYRALELTAQIWLRSSHDIQTGDVKLDLVPEAERSKVERLCDDDGRIKIGLLKAWGVVAAFTDDPLGRLFVEQRARLLDFLRVRNESLFAHGFRPVSDADYMTHVPIVIEFLQKCISEAVAAGGLARPVVLEQLPVSFLDE